MKKADLCPNFSSLAFKWKKVFCLSVAAEHIPPKPVGLQQWVKIILFGLQLRLMVLPCGCNQMKAETKVFESRLPLHVWVPDFQWLEELELVEYFFHVSLNMASLGFLTGHFQGIQISHMVACILRKHSKGLGWKLWCFFWLRLRRLAVSLLPLVSESYGQPKLNTLEV